MDYPIWTVVVVIITFIFYKANRRRYYFKERGIPQPFEWPFVGISGSSIFKGRHVSHTLKDVYNINKEAKYVGCHMLTSRCIVVRDLDLIKSVLVKNFDHFAYRKSFVDENADPLFGKNMFFINGDKWRDVRTLLSPAFTSSKMRGMFGPMNKCADNFSRQFLDIYKDKKEINTKDAFTRYANDVIATCAFGIEVDSLKDRENEFYVTGKRCTDFQKMPLVKLLFMTAFHRLSQILGMRIISKSDTDYFVKIIKSTIRTREEKGITRPDMLQMMMEARDTKSYESLLDITAQAFTFFLGGFESTASHMCLIANELAAHPDIQKRLQDEVDAAMEKCNGKPTYEVVNNDMPYMDAVFSETMRLYPVSFLGRVVSKDFELPPALPDSKPFVAKEGLEVFIPSSAIHLDPDYYEDPETFNPDRFLNKKITTFDVTNLGFGMGPRVCIGNRFAILETKILFLHLLTKCNLELCKKSPVPFEYDKFSFVPNAKNGFWLKISPRK
ncbi:cytochrome P450 9e2-like [Copidosoma floridanum]|uniref:cytochrome P450 9e2-like n=1 Tax=Copidosoma floridanum TaxID=29053 RepID=UPI0006C99EBC|nr:cytochrome P450 9e2-like [Copidosoma floridanum]